MKNKYEFFTSDNENNERQGENLNISERKKGGFQKKSWYGISLNLKAKLLYVK